MFKLKKKGKESASRIHSAIRGWAAPWCERISQKIRLHGRVRLANIWGRKHPKLLMWYFCGIMVLNILLGTAYSLFVEHRDEPALDPERFASSMKVFDGLQQVNRNREAVKESYRTLMATGNTVLNELDSLMAIKEKNHQDSIEILIRYQKIQTLNNFIGNEEN